MTGNSIAPPKKYAVSKILIKWRCMEMFSCGVLPPIAPIEKLTLS